MVQFYCTGANEDWTICFLARSCKLGLLTFCFYVFFLRCWQAAFPTITLLFFQAGCLFWCLEKADSILSLPLLCKALGLWGFVFQLLFFSGLFNS